MMGALGTGNVKPGRVTASLGTSGTIYAYSRQPVVDSEGEIAAFCDSTDAWLPLVCTMNVTVATEQTRRLFDWSYADFEKAAASAPAGANGVLFLPYLQGERTPNFPGARGSFHGLSADNHTRENVARATMEGVTLGMAYGLERLRASGIAPQEIRLIGGGSQSRLWRSLCADIFNAPVATLENAESAAFGAAIQAAAVARPEKTVEEWSDLLVATREDETMPPDPERSALYRQLQEEQQRLAFRLHERGA